MTVFEKDVGIFSIKEFTDGAAERNGLLQEPFRGKTRGGVTLGEPIRFACILGKRLASAIKMVCLSLVAP